MLAGYIIGKLAFARRRMRINALAYSELRRILASREARGDQVVPLDHPVKQILVASDYRTLAVASRTDSAIRRLKNAYGRWIEAKERLLFDDPDPKNQAAILGEIRAIGELAYVWGDRIACPAAGSDFRVDVSGQEVGIEVITLQGSASNTERTLGTVERTGIIIHETEVAISVKSTAIACGQESSINFREGPVECVTRVRESATL